MLAALINERFGPAGVIKDDRTNRLAMHQHAYRCIADTNSNTAEVERNCLLNIRILDKELIVHKAIRRSFQLSQQMRDVRMVDLLPCEVLAKLTTPTNINVTTPSSVKLPELKVYEI